jgi:acetylornithine deacetylase/succinyl-diaminopimelate desuccinylase-like protein
MPLLDSYLQLLTRFVAHASVSTDPAFLPHIQATAQDLASWLGEQGFKPEVIEGYENPLVFATYAADPAYPTCLVYGHYDVQPASKEDGWESDPFALSQKDGRLVARGAVDNKGQFLAHLTVITELIRSGGLKWNIEVLVEGNEETGSHGLTRFLQEHPEKIGSSVALISDGEIHSLAPKIEIGYRGTVQIEVTARTSAQDLHSGLFGGTVPNAARELGRLLESMYGVGGALTVEGVAAGAHQPNPQERAWADQTTPTKEVYSTLSGTKTVWSEEGQSLGSQLIFRPAIEIIGLASGYMGTGFRNSIPATAQAKLNVRLAPGQHAEEIFEAVVAHLKAHAPEYLEVTFSHDGHSEGTLVEATRPIFQHAAALLEQTYGTAPTMAYCGASLPFLLGFQAVPNLDLLLVPLGNDDCLMHAVGENIAVANVEKALAFSTAFFSQPPIAG